jgi:spore maturation protein CgeB
MRLLVIGADSNYAIERFYLKYWKEFGKNITLEFFTSQNLFYKYYNKNILNKIIFRLGLSSIYTNINQELNNKIDEFKPDIIFVFKGMEVFPASLTFAKKKGIKLVNYNPDNPFIFSGKGSGNSNITKSIGLYDFHFTYSDEIKKQIDLKFNIPTTILPFGFDIEESVYNLVKNKGEINRVCFIGNPDIFRTELIQNLANKGIEIDVYGYNWRKFIKHQKIKCFNTVSDDVLWYTLRKYRVQLNIMRPHNLNSHNMRTFEIPAVGGIQLAPNTIDHQLFFEADKEIFLYDTVDGCINKINYLLSLTTEQSNHYREFARDVCIKNKHSYKDRALQVMEVFEKLHNE